MFPFSLQHFISAAKEALAKEVPVLALLAVNQGARNA